MFKELDQFLLYMRNAFSKQKRSYQGSYQGTMCKKTRKALKHTHTAQKNKIDTTKRDEISDKLRNLKLM
jgi:phosphoserine phosphatase